MATLGRRAFLFVASMLWPVVHLRAAFQQRPAAAPAVSVEEFMRLSQRLTERPRLDAEVGVIYFNAIFAVPENRPLLARLARENGPELTPAHIALERTIVECWYTGTYSVAGERRLATHAGALMWGALGVRAPGSCAGAFAEWSRPPQRNL
jgi:hypothetical protein